MDHTNHCYEKVLQFQSFQNFAGCMFGVHYSRTVPGVTQACNCKSMIKVAFNPLYMLSCSDRVSKRHVFVEASKCFTTLHVVHANAGNDIISTCKLPLTRNHEHHISILSSATLWSIGQGESFPSRSLVACCSSCFWPESAVKVNLEWWAN